MHQAVLSSMYTPLIEISTLILTLIFPWYFAGYFPLAFLEDWQSLSSFRGTSLCLDPVIWDLLASSASTLSQNC